MIRGRRFDCRTSSCPTGCRWSTRSRLLSADEKRFAQPDPGPHLRQHLRPGRALHQRQGARARPRALARRPDRPRSAGALQRRGAQASGALPPHRSLVAAGHAAGLPLRRRPERRRRAVLGKSHLGGAGADAAHRAVHAGPLQREHRAGRRLSRAVQGRLPVPLDGREPARVLDELEWLRARRALDGAASAIERSTISSRSSPRWTASCRRKPRPTRCISREPAAARSTGTRCEPIDGEFLRAYRWQYIFSGVSHPRFQAAHRPADQSPTQFDPHRRRALGQTRTEARPVRVSPARAAASTEEHPCPFPCRMLLAFAGLDPGGPARRRRHAALVADPSGPRRRSPASRATRRTAAPPIGAPPGPTPIASRTCRYSPVLADIRRSHPCRAVAGFDRLD